jgi:linoleoyl-CoA desaturase
MKQARVKFVPTEKTRFASVLRSRVEAYFTENNISTYGNRTLAIKSIVLLSGYVLPFVAMLVFLPGPWISLSLFALMGFAKAGVGMSVMHDANHGSFSKSKHVNWWMSHVLNGLGGSTHNWRLQHNILHHTYTNIDKMDDDIQDRVLMKFSPHSQTKWYHKYQWIFSFFFYGLLTVYWVLAKDLVQYRSYSARGIHGKSKHQNVWWLVRLTLVKIIYLFVFIALPILLGMHWGLVVGGFMLMHFIAGLVLTVTFQLAHTLEETSHPLPNLDGIIDNDWAIHQMATTVNFAPHNKLLSWYMGGLNYQVEHHLFARISHVHYPKIAPIVRQTAAEFGVPYLENPTLGSAINSHIRYLKTIGKLPDLNEALG